MKKILIILIILITLFGFIYIKNKPFDKEKRLTGIKNNIESALADNNINNYSWEYSYDKEIDGYSANTDIKLEKEVHLYIEIMANDNYLKQDLSSAYISIINYNCSADNMYKTIDIDCFLDIANSVSKRELKKSEVLEFFKSDEYNFETDDEDCLANKRSSFDFFENYVICYDYSGTTEDVSFNAKCK